MADNFITHEIKTAFSPSGKMISRLIIINIIVFLLLRITDIIFDLTQMPYSIDTVIRFLALPSSLQQLIYKLWTFITYAFTHFDVWHIVFNMLWLYWIGIILADFLGNKKILPIYMMGSWFGGLLYILAFNLFPYFKDSVTGSYCIGASAGVMAIVLAAATLSPNYVIVLILWRIPLKWMAFIMVVLDLININKANAGGHIAHLGGALFGFLFIQQLQKGNDWSRWFNNMMDVIVSFFSSKPRLKVSYSKSEKEDKSNIKKAEEKNQKKLDAILDKISKSGYESLSKEEKEFLFKTSRDNK